LKRDQAAASFSTTKHRCQNMPIVEPRSVPQRTVGVLETAWHGCRVADQRKLANTSIGLSQLQAVPVCQPQHDAKALR
jgi:hypothetical protein